VVPVAPAPQGLGPDTINPSGDSLFTLTNVFPVWSTVNTNG
jgi:hypothetical protein